MLARRSTSPLGAFSGRGRAGSCITLLILIGALSRVLLGADTAIVPVGRGINFVAIPSLNPIVAPQLKASTILRLFQTPFTLRSFGSDFGEASFYRFPGQSVSFDFPILPALGIVVASSNARTITVTLPTPHAGGVVTTVAGLAHRGFAGDGKEATQALLDTPTDVAFDPSGNLLIADAGNARVRCVNRTTGIITTVAGLGLRDQGGQFVSSGDGLLATSASFGLLYRIDVDAAGNVFVVDGQHYRRIDGKTGIIASQTELPEFAATVIRGEDGSLYYSSESPGGIFRRAPDGAVTTLASGFGIQLLTGNSRRLVFSVSQAGAIRYLDVAKREVTHLLGGGGPNISVDGVAAEDAAVFQPLFAVEDRDGNLFLSDYSANRVLRVDAATRTVTTFVGDGYIDWTSSSFAGRYQGDGKPALCASLNAPLGLRLGPDGALYVADSRNHCVRRIGSEPAANVSCSRNIIRIGRGLNLISLGSVRTTASAPMSASGLARLTGSGFVVRTAVKNDLARYDCYIPSLHTRDFDILPWQACLINSPISRAVDLTDGDTMGLGDILTVAGTSEPAFGGDGGQAAFAQLRKPEAVAADRQGRMYVADTGNGRVRLIQVDGTISTVVGGTATRTSSDSVPGPFVPTKLCIGPSDECYCYDRASDRILKIDVLGGVSEVAKNAGYVTAMGCSTSGELFFYEEATYSLCVFEPREAKLTRLIGGRGPLPISTGTTPFESASLSNVSSIVGSSEFGILIYAIGHVFAVDLQSRTVRLLYFLRTRENPTGTLLVSKMALRGDDTLFVDEELSRVIARTPSEAVRTIAGDSFTRTPQDLDNFIAGRYSGDGGPAELASLSGPLDITLDNQGNLLIADTRNNVIRKVRLSQ